MTKVLFLLILAVVAAERADACIELGPFNPADKTKAEIVFEGKAVKCELLKTGDGAKITFDVLKTIRGEAKKQWVVIFPQNTNVSPPNTLSKFRAEYGEKSEVGIRIPATAEPYDLKTGMINPPKGNEKFPVLVEGPCNPPYVLPITRATPI